MPELPEVETVCRGLARRLEGRRIARVEVRRARLRFPLPRDFAKRLDGRRVERVYRRAKYILVALDDGTILLAHLGMTGRFYIHPSPPASYARHDHVVFVLDDGGVITFNDARRFGLMDLLAQGEAATHKLLQGIGPEPLDDAFTPERLSAALKGKKTPIKAALLDQRVVSGLGNIYVSEALFRAGISPRRLAGTVAGARAVRLVPAIKAVLREAIKAGGSTLRDYVQANGELGYFQSRFRVYDRAGQPCLTCGAPVQRIVQSGRSTFFCKACQS